MKLYLLRPIELLDPADNPWDPWYDKAFGFVVRAESEEEARRIAQNAAGDEKYDRSLTERKAKLRTPWLDPKYSTCDPLTDEGEPGLIMQDFRGA
jgi:hypothetical protein